MHQINDGSLAESDWPKTKSKYMHDIVEIQKDDRNKYHDDLFLHDIEKGLMAHPKYIESKFLYDAKGSELFNQITELSEYYLTRTEKNILHTYKKEIVHLMSHEQFNLIELGPGDGSKAEILIRELLRDHHQFSYMPVDISTDYLINLMHHFEIILPQLFYQGLHADYFQALEWLQVHSKKEI